MIDIRREQMITFGRLARSLPRRRMDRPVHPSTVHRWRSKGIRGIRLEAVRIGGAWQTSQEAFERFVAKLTAAEEGPSPNASAPLRTKVDKDDAAEQLAKTKW